MFRLMPMHVLPIDVVCLYLTTLVMARTLFVMPLSTTTARYMLAGISLHVVPTLQQMPLSLLNSTAQLLKLDGLRGMH
jgi:hypothetical protein